METLKVTLLLLILCAYTAITEAIEDDNEISIPNNEISIPLEDRVDALETQILVQSLKSSKAILRLDRKLSQKIESKITSQNNGGLVGSNNVLDRIDKIEATVDDLSSVVGALVKGLADQKSANANDKEQFNEQLNNFHSSIEDRIDEFENDMIEQENGAAQDQVNSLASRIELINATLEELKKKIHVLTNVNKVESTNPVLQDCPKEWTKLNDDMCYLFVHDEPADWFTASVKCHEIGATLAEVKDDATLKKLTDYMAPIQAAWIGGTDEEVEGKWVWIGTNEEIQYLNWMGIQPRPAWAEYQDCLEMWEPGFNDQTCTKTSPYWCQKPLNSF